MAGANNDQKLAATITPPVKPNIPSNNRRFIVLKGNTKAAPAAVIPHVNSVAIKAAITGPSPSNHAINSAMFLGFRWGQWTHPQLLQPRRRQRADVLVCQHTAQSNASFFERQQGVSSSPPRTPVTAQVRAGSS